MNKEKYKVSIIVAVYNVGLYIERCLQSITNQTYNNLEIIVVNDGSTDNSACICNEFANSDDRIIIISQENSGLSAARNSGMEKVTGEYTIFVDGDDYLDKDCVKICSKYFNEDFDFLMFSFTRKYNNKLIKTEIFDKTYIKFENEKLENLKQRFIGPMNEQLSNPHKMEDINPVWNKIYKTKIISKIKFVDTKIIGTEDLWFNINVIENCNKVLFINESLYFYNKENENSLTRKYNKELFNRWKVLYLKIQNWINENDVDKNLYFQCLNNRIIINLLAVTRNIVTSSMNNSDKIAELKCVLSDEVYAEKYNDFNYNYLPLHWYVFYKACEKKRYREIIILINIAEKIKKYV